MNSAPPLPPRATVTVADGHAGTAETFSGINHSSSYDQEYWYTSQLFDPDWTPRDTLEYAPPADWHH